MKKGTLTRNQVIGIVGLKAVEKVESLNCEPTNRVGYNGSCQNNDLIEWASTVELDDGTKLTVYYYTDIADEAIVEANGGDWGSIDWVISGYQID